MEAGGPPDTNRARSRLGRHRPWPDHGSDPWCSCRRESTGCAHLDAQESSLRTIEPPATCTAGRWMCSAVPGRLMSARSRRAVTKMVCLQRTPTWRSTSLVRSSAACAPVGLRADSYRNFYRTGKRALRSKPITEGRIKAKDIRHVVPRSRCGVGRRCRTIVTLARCDDARSGK